MKRHSKKLYFFLVIIFIVFVFCYLLCCTKKIDLVYVDFDTSMQKNAYNHILNKGWGPVYNILKEQYEKHKGRQLENRLHIPKIIHQIWLGSPFPEKYKAFQQSWLKYHPGWEYKLWTEKELAQLNMHNRNLYEKSINYGEKSDIARYEILYQFGGVYVDTDYECLKSLEPFHCAYDFYIGIQPLDTNAVQLGIGLIGVAPHHPLIKVALDGLHKQMHEKQQIIERTGPIYFTKVFCLFAPKLKDATIAFPATYFYPRGYTQSAEEKTTWQKPESYAVHHWAGSWLKKEGFVH